MNIKWFLLFLVIISEFSLSSPYKQYTITLNGNQKTPIILPPGSEITFTSSKKIDIITPDEFHLIGNISINIKGNSIFPITIIAKEATIKRQHISQGRLKYISQLIKMGEIDQRIRGKISIRSLPYSEQAMKEQAVLDRRNQIVLEKIIKKYGWPGFSFAGEKGESTAFLVLQHADTSFQKKYLFLFRDAVKNGDASPSRLAMLEDRINIADALPQVYGTQLKLGEDGKYYAHSIANPDQVDKKRTEVGLPPLSEYLKMVNQSSQGSGIKHQ